MSVHTADFKFIKDKIYRLHTAIMYSTSNELIKVPNCLITLLRMDEEGHMWFQCKAPVVYIQNYEQSFPARLHFFRKGFNYFIDVNGSATIIKAVADHKTAAAGIENERLLLKLDVNHIEYAEPQTKRKTWLNEWIEKTYSWFINHIVFPRNQKSFLTKLQHNR
jgi:hypothetical protein